ncbi:hypothetical protein [Oxynema aestuarii]|jgi:hypothetical protein|uniref:Uncharacterized protein n=1 Tax=Oxynema aestuarii AP17 TaxID=2064643 RepID=A0A6H1TUC3_9CYAN|nr:hypothetical protein [Oxynema aestuarii]QIZ70151.1 hypothetical protein HCG48_05870 [Oxynema aestuarii AP17]
MVDRKPFEGLPQQSTATAIAPSESGSIVPDPEGDTAEPFPLQLPNGSSLARADLASTLIQQAIVDFELPIDSW